MDYLFDAASTQATAAAVAAYAVGVPAYVLLPGGGSNSATYSSGYLGVAHGPFSALGDPNAKDYSVRALATPAGSSLAALESRRQLLARVDTAFSPM